MDVGYRSKAQMKKKGVKFWVNPTWFEFGVQPHVIMTREYKESGHSSYQLEGNGRKYGVIVQHPGIVSKNFLRNTVMENIDEITTAEQDSLKEIENMMIEKGMTINLGEDEEID